MMWGICALLVIVGSFMMMTAGGGIVEDGDYAFIVALIMVGLLCLAASIYVGRIA